MPRRASSLTNISNLAVSREIDSKYDVVKAVADKLDELEVFLETDTDALIASLNEAVDFTGITVVAGAVANWDPVTKELTVPTLQGEKGTDLTLDTVEHIGNGVFRWVFSDNTTFVTPNLTGNAGAKGETGISVHHTKGTGTTDPEGDFSTAGKKDTYTMYGDADENIVLGWFTVQNGFGPYEYAQKSGYTGTEAEFYLELADLTNTATRSQLAQWRAEANEMTTDSFANELEDVEVKIYSSNDDGTFSSEVQVDEYSALHYKVKSQYAYETMLALGNGFAVADNAEKDALTELTTADTVFVSDDGDGKWARYQVIAVTDGLGSTSTFEVIMDEDTYLHANTASDVKATYESNADTNAYTDAEKTKLAGIEEFATADQTATEIETLYEGIVDTNKYTDAEKIKLADTEITSQLDARDTANRSTDNHTDGLTNGVYTLAERDKLGAIDQELATTSNVTFVTVNGRDVDEDGAKLDTIESNAKDDQTGAEIKALYEAELNTNEYSDAEKVKVGLITVAQAVDLDTIESDTASNNAHKISDGSDHTFIDQDVTTTGTPSFNSVQLNGGIGTQGLINWNADEETLDVALNGAILQVGQETHIHIRNNTATLIPNGTVVMATGTLGASGRITAAPYDGTSHVKYILGIATTDIGAGADGKVTNFGKVRNIDTSSYAEGDVLYASTNGTFTNIEPATGVNAAIAIVLSVHAVNGTIMVRFTPIDGNEFQPYDANIVSDANYVHTDNNYTTVEKELLASHTSATDNPHSVTKAQIGLSEVDNTSDIDKPVSTAAETAINAVDGNALAYAIALG